MKSSINSSILIRKASLSDFEQLYALGLQIPELKVSTTEDFMEPDEFRWCIKNKKGILLLAEQQNKLQNKEILFQVLL